MTRPRASQVLVDDFSLTEAPEEPIDPRIEELEQSSSHGEKSSRQGQEKGSSQKDEECTVAASLEDASKPVYVRCVIPQL